MAPGLFLMISELMYIEYLEIYCIKRTKPRSPSSHEYKGCRRAGLALVFLLKEAKWELLSEKISKVKKRGETFQTRLSQYSDQEKVT